MGISGLLPLLKSIQKSCNLKKFAGQTVGVDAYGWLHRGTVACAVDIALGKPTRKYVDFSMHRVRMLQHFGVTPYLVFDGDYLPSKAATESERAARREECRKRGLDLYKMNKPSQAHLELQKAVDVTPYMARELIEELKQAGIEYVVAPYEADAQLIYLEKQGIIHAMVSEDSDLLVFGAKRLLTKLDQYGDCVEIERANFTACRSISLVGWSDADFRRMAILSGCDYLSSITGMGLKNAYRLVRKYKTIERILQILQFDGKFKVPTGYLEAFKQAELTFLHQRVYCPMSRKLVMLNDVDDSAQQHDLKFIGTCVDPDVASAVATGDLDPVTKRPIDIAPTKATLAAASAKARWEQNAGTPIDKAKGNQSIDAFFKTKRTPLAELDPNCFTPSPKQQQTLREAAGNVWQASPIAPSTNVVQQLVSRSNSYASNDKGSDQSQRAAILRESQEKRRNDFRENDAVRSRFFDGTASTTHKTRGSARTAKKRRNTDFQIWSDDSVEEAMSQLPEITQESIGPPTCGLVQASASTSCVDITERIADYPRKPAEAEHQGNASVTRASSSSTQDQHGARCCSPRPMIPIASPIYRATTESTLIKSSSLVTIPGTPSKKKETCAKPRNREFSSSEVRSAIACEEIVQASPAQRTPARGFSRSRSTTSLASDNSPVSFMGARNNRQGSKMPRLIFNHSIGPDASALRGSEDWLIPDVEAEDHDDPAIPPKTLNSTLNLGRFAFFG